MSVLRSVARQVIPAHLRRVFWTAHYKGRSQWTGKYRPELEWWFDRRHWLSILRLRVLQGKHTGERCFIIGNGPSLSKMDLSPLRDEVTFGLNRIYLLFPKLGFSTTYYVSVNRLVIEQCAHEIEDLPMPKFINWHARDVIRFTPDMMFIRDPYEEPYDVLLDFSTNPASRIWEGSTVTYVAMQLAYYMGFRQVILIGVDHSFATKGEPHRTVVSSGPDPNHFDPTYFGKGFRWQLPDLEASERAYRLAKRYFEQDGREIVDATLDGKLRVFRRMDYQALF
ncbi:MAG: 6-hydroxymethylpterin diphosphokinase MptE-like protein [Anaerolineae bacterium]